MNLEFLKEIMKQVASIWREIKVYQKFTVILVILFLISLLGFMVFNATSTRYTPLYPTERLMISDAAEVKAYLDSGRVDYKLRGDTLILVPSKDVHRLRMDLASVGLPKLHSGKGFELFDTNTWIKGEKELQVLEMRALKGQLEQDIGEYDNIKNASVMLDIAPPRPFGGALYKTKASVILSLMPGARLNSSQLRAITYHIAGSVRGLTPNMVAISDTTGKLYQALDPSGDFDMLRSSEIALEERLKAKIDGMLALVVGLENYYSTVQVTMNREKYSQERKIFSGTVDGVALGEAVPLSVTESGLQLAETERAESGTPGTNTEAVAGAVASSGEELLNRNENRNQTYRQFAVPVDHIKVHSAPGRIDSISIGVLIDKTIAVDERADIPEGEIQEGMRNAEALKDEIESQLEKILEGYGLTAQPAVDFVEFDHTKFKEREEKESWDSLMDTMTRVGSVVFVVLTVLGMFWTFNRFWKKHMMQPPTLDLEDEEEEEILLPEEPSLMEVEAMVEAIKTRLHNDPVAVSDTLHDWLAEDNDPDFPPPKA